MAAVRKWTPEEDAVLRRMRSRQMAWEDIAACLGRTRPACETRWRSLNVPDMRRRGAPWSEEEDAVLKKLMTQGLSWSDAADRLPGRSSQACAARGKLLGVRAAKPVQKRPGALSMRRCHDCGRPTADYRCPKCLAAWRMKNGVSQAAEDSEEAYTAFGSRWAID